MPNSIAEPLFVSVADEDYWSIGQAALIQRLVASEKGLSSAEAAARLESNGPNTLTATDDGGPWSLLLSQLRNPLLVLLLLAVLTSLASSEWFDASVVLTIVTASVGIGFVREYQARNAAALLRSRILMRCTVVRDGGSSEIPASELVAGDVVMLSAGCLVPADGRLIQAEHFYVNESVLTGESFPVEKRCGDAPAGAGVSVRTNCVFLGTNVRSGSAKFVVARTARTSEFGKIANRLRLRPPETEFDRGISQFGYLLASAMLVLVVLVLAANVALGRPLIQTLLFSIALAVGLSPELLPAILSVNLARGAIEMGRRGVLVRRLNAIENLGSMDILCTDKTGTLTEGVVRLQQACDVEGEVSATVLEMACCNSALQTGFSNPLDAAILQVPQPDLSRFQKLAEIPYDFVRKRLSVVIDDGNGPRMVTKGAFANVLQDCTRLSDDQPFSDTIRAAAVARCEHWNRQGIRVLGVASRSLPRKESYSRDDERELTFEGFLTFVDRPKEGTAQALAKLRQLGVHVKMISGDTKLVCAHVAEEVGLRGVRILTSGEIDLMSDAAFWHSAEKTDLFAEVDPNQKERIILALKKTGHVVGFLGDGVNDAPAMHAADTSLSVDQAVDVAREAADFVLLERDLDVICWGIEEGRTTFANTLKYVLMAASANFGNMVSMAVASLLLPFLPLLAGQVLLNNLLGDIPAFSLAQDRVDREMIDRPRRWNMKFLLSFMVQFGLLSSVFDLLTFGMLRLGFGSGESVFRTGWFVESMMTQLAVILIIRTRGPWLASRPARPLILAVVAVATVAVLIPYVSWSAYLGFVPLKASLFVCLISISGVYLVTAEMLKRRFFAMHDNGIRRL